MAGIDVDRVSLLERYRSSRLSPVLGPVTVLSLNSSSRPTQPLETLERRLY